MPNTIELTTAEYRLFQKHPHYSLSNEAEFETLLGILSKRHCREVKIGNANTLDYQLYSENNLKKLTILLKSQPQLECLSFSYGTLCEEAIKHLVDLLTNNANIIKIYLNVITCDNKSLSTLIDCIASSKHLKEIYLNKCQLTDMHIERLAMGLNRNSNSALETINLDGNKITSDGTKLLLASLPHTILKNIILAFNPIETSVYPELEEAISHNNSLTLFAVTDYNQATKTQNDQIENLLSAYRKNLSYIAKR